MSKKVSVCITTYNQEKFIAQAVTSALNQKVSFDFEIVIGEDCSTDRTAQILTELQQAHPEIIRLLIHEKNLGMWGKFNFIATLQACQGEYIAWLDGDDYWIDPHKLQKQVDFLDSHPDFAICFHNSRMIRDDDSETTETFCPPDQKEISTVEDLLAGNFIHSGSSVFRRGLFKEFPEWFLTSFAGDWSVHVLNARHGKIRYLNEVMAAYRVHEAGAWSLTDRSHQLLSGINLLDHFNRYLEFRYNKQIKTAQYGFYAELAEMNYQKGDLTGSKSFLVKCLKLGLSNYRLPTTQQLGRLIKLENPTLYNLIRSLRNLVYSHRS